MWPETHLDEADAVYTVRLHDVSHIELGDCICFLQARFRMTAFVANDLIEGTVIAIDRYIRLRMTAKNQFTVSDLEEVQVNPATVTKIWAKRAPRPGKSERESFLPTPLPWRIQWKRITSHDLDEGEYALMRSRYERAQL